MSDDARTNTARPLSDIRDSGLLWLINRTALHPRGYAMALHFGEDGECIGWSIVGDGGEPWSYADSMEAEENDLFQRIRELLP